MKAPFLVSENEVFIKLSHCGIHPLFLMADGFRTYTFGRGETLYLRVTDAQKWFEDEAPHATVVEAVEYRAAADYLSKARAKILSERKEPS